MENQIRFAVGSPADIRSSVWRLWGQKDELYLAARTFAGQIKVSFHKSGIARIAPPSTTPRPALLKWNYEREDCAPLSRIFSIVVQPRMVKFPIRDKLRDKAEVVLVPAPNDRQKMIFAISLAGPHVTKEDILALPRDRDLHVLGCVRLKTRYAWLTSYVDDCRPQIEQPVIERYLSMIRAPAPSVFADGSVYVHLFDSENAQGPMLTDIQLGREHLFETKNAGAKWIEVIGNPAKLPGSGE